MKTIRLEKVRSGWLAATFIDGKPDPEQMRLFGTHVLPTCWTSAAQIDEVMNGIRKLNPEAQVTLVIP